MQWILQEFEDTAKLVGALDRLRLPYTLHKVVPFVGELDPAPVVPDPNDVVLFGSYTLWRTAERNGYRPGVWKLRPFLHEAAWRSYMLNGPDALVMPLHDVPESLVEDRDWFVRPVEDSKEIAGRVRPAGELRETAAKVLRLAEDEIPNGSLRHDTLLMLTPPAQIEREWRLWVVNDEVVTFSLYREGRRVVYRPEIDDDALAFACDLIAANPDYAYAYVIDICRTPDGLRLLETNCINAAGFYAADLTKLAAAVNDAA